MDTPLPGFFDETPPSPPSKPTRTTQTEIERLKQENAQLQKALADHNQLRAANTTGLSESLRKDPNFLTDMARFSEELLSKEAIKKKYGFTQETWTRLGKDDALFDAIEAEKLRRIRDGSSKRERAQQLVVEAPAVLGNILRDEKASAKHRIDSAKVLDQFAANGPTAAPETERFIISINLGEDYKLTFDKSIRPNPNDNGTVTVIDTTATNLETIAQREEEGSGPV
jgi:hypothetical protein